MLNIPAPLTTLSWKKVLMQRNEDTPIVKNKDTPDEGRIEINSS